VDKIYRVLTVDDPPISSVCDFFYDADNKLIKMASPSGTSMYIFEYENNRVSKIKYSDSYPIEYSTLFFYNLQGQLIREETRYSNGDLGDWSEFYYKNGVVDSIYCYEGHYILGQWDLIFWHSIVPVYDESHNVVKVIYTRPKTNELGMPHPYETVVREQFYEYDDHLQPNFGIDYLFAFSALVGMSDIYTYERLLSVNNMTKAFEDNIEITYHYTYNEHGLPDSYQYVWNGFAHSVFKITYKPIEVGISEPPSIAEVQVYPNPTSEELRVTSYELRVTDIEVFDIYGRKQKAEGRRQKAEGEILLDISGLCAGIYFVKIRTDAGEVVKKVIKN
jgi:hypothetical protein